MNAANGSGQNAFRLAAGLLALACCLPTAGLAAPAAVASDSYYTEEHVFGSRPEPGSEMHLGEIGVTGLKARIYRDVVVKVEGIVPRTPADGKFKIGQILAGVNGESFKGRNPFVMLGNALTKAEATDGTLTFDVRETPEAPVTKVTVTIPVLGAYSKTWPLTCAKSDKIIKQAAEYYAYDPEFKKRHFAGKGIEAALASLFLLSTGDDKYLPCVKAYFAQFLPATKAIGDHTWNNGYNGIACAEYYLRTGDKDVLPILQYFCEDAKLRQKFGCSWGHWGRGIAPGYVAGGLMNPAGSQVLTTLLLSKECGVTVDEPTLIGALRFWYRFTGHGTVPYGDHRGEGGLGSNGKDAMSAVAMLVASGAQGDTTIYKKSRDYLCLSTVDSYVGLVRGHADEGRGDAIWRGLVSSYLLDSNPAEYHAAMHRLEWWYDLSRRSSGGLGVATCQRDEFDEEGSGAGVALTYTAPLKTLRITGAPRSKYAKDFTLPEHLWGRPADEAFLSASNIPAYATYGETEPTHVPFWKLGSAYTKPDADLKTLPRQEILKNIYHRNYMIRVQAAKALRTVGAYDELEKLLQGPDPRVRRAALDGIIDYNYWFGMGSGAMKTEELTPGMLAEIKMMLAFPYEAVWVVDGALMALSLAPAKEIESCLPLIMPWTTNDDWWLRESAFMALLGTQKDDTLFAKVLPTLLNMMVSEYHTMPRERFTNSLRGVLQKKPAGSPLGEMILAGFKRAITESEIKPGERAAEGAFNVTLAADACLRQDKGSAIEIARLMKTRFDALEAGQIVNLVASPNSNREGNPYGLYTTLKDLPPAQRTELTDILYNDYRPELIKRMQAQAEPDLSVMDSVLDLTQLKNPDIGWKAIGKPEPAARIWHYLSFDPQPADVMPKREKKRFRDVALPAGCENWVLPEFNDSAWKTGRGPIGIGMFNQGKIAFTNNADWGAGEFLLMRTSFELDELDYDLYRISVLARQGFHIYLNGHKIHTYIWWKDMPHYRLIMLTANETRYLRKGANTLAVYANVEYQKEEPQGQIDVFLEGLRKKDLEL